jgi:hypothetical protein
MFQIYQHLSDQFKENSFEIFAGFAMLCYLGAMLWLTLFLTK